MNHRSRTYAPLVIHKLDDQTDPLHTDPVKLTVLQNRIEPT
jgi:hypothetical protein